MNTYEWTPTNTAPQNYPVYVSKGLFKGTDGSVIKTPDKRTLYFGWQQTGSVYLSGPDKKSLPNSLEATWFSFAEQKYYTINLTLPVRDMEEYFTEGFVNPRTGNTETFTTISYGIAPGGLVVVWLVGTAHRVEIASGKGTVIAMEFDTLIPTTEMNEKEYTDFTLNEHSDATTRQAIERGMIPFEKWENYRITYPWKVVLQHADSFTPKMARIQMWNGEQEVQFFNKNTNRILNNWALPASMRLEWTDKNSNNFAAKVSFTEEDIQNAFSNVDPNEAVSLEFRIDTFNDALQVFVVTKEEELLVKNVSVTIFEKESK
ncbi:hypothetical protein ULVI_12205 [Cochleicola gelatinilyticus]|uniref:DUF2931 domain-containing protein n=2 Tax=Cochleicola gelatinilyticus TaxID=1763537 RepID=A0A167H5E4_9FLAO|nr:hypothetical protein ULVI_12205 [Cochleicola gelatinilyticus]